jgi:hypothetical protein
MAQQNARLDKSTVAYGFLAAGLGLFFILLSLGVFGASPKATPRSAAVGFCAGLAFLAGGLAVVIQTLAGVTAGPDGGMSGGAPPWVRRTLYGLALTVVGCLGLLGLWAAFGPGPREFTTSMPLLGHYRIGEGFGRAVFGFGAVLVCLFFIAMVINAARTRLGRRKS